MQNEKNSKNGKNDAIDRRNFLQSAVGAITAVSLGLYKAKTAKAQEAPVTSKMHWNKPQPPFIGIQMGPHTMLDEGIEHSLDLIKETAAVNAVMIYSQSFHGGLQKPTQFLATDHGVPLKETQKRRFPSIWVKTHSRFYADTILKPKPVEQDLEYANRDLFSEIAEPAKRREIKVYERILESSGRAIENFAYLRQADDNRLLEQSGI
jgi:hypothetical protein